LQPIAVTRPPQDHVQDAESLTQRRRILGGLTMAELKKTLCNRDCPDVCSIVATVEDGRVTRLAGD
jgi:hypothetical protein